MVLLNGIALNAYTQPPPDDDIIKDIEENDAMTIGTRLYELEQACRHAIQILGTDYQDIKVQDYVSYDLGDSVRVIFWKEETSWQLILAEFTFPKPVVLDQYTDNTESRLPTDEELTYIKIKKEVKKEISMSNFFKRYQNSFLQPIILDQKENYVAYVITIPNISTSLLFDNDYKLTFDKKGQETDRREINTNMQAVPSIVELHRKKANYTEHKHPKTGPHGLTATDICILLLYEPYVNWEEHRVEAEDFTSIFEFKNKSLTNQQKK